MNDVAKAFEELKENDYVKMTSYDGSAFEGYVSSVQKGDDGSTVSATLRLSPSAMCFQCLQDNGYYGNYTGDFNMNIEEYLPEIDSLKVSESTEEQRKYIEEDIEGVTEARRIIPVAADMARYLYDRFGDSFDQVVQVEDFDELDPVKFDQVAHVEELSDITMELGMRKQRDGSLSVNENWEYYLAKSNSPFFDYVNYVLWETVDVALKNGMTKDEILSAVDFPEDRIETIDSAIRQIEELRETDELCAAIREWVVKQDDSLDAKQVDAITDKLWGQYFFGENTTGDLVKGVTPWLETSDTARQIFTKERDKLDKGAAVKDNKAKAKMKDKSEPER